MRLCGYMTTWLHDYVVPDSGAIHGYLTMTWLPDFVILWVHGYVATGYLCQGAFRAQKFGDLRRGVVLLLA